MNVNASDKISKFFTFKEALWLPQWNRMASSEDGLTEEILENLKELFSKMDKVREYFNRPIKVHVCYRPEEYNKLVKGAKNSAHKFGKACDFSILSIKCTEARSTILKDNKLEEWEMRMEDNGEGNWIHLDIYPVGPSGRFFKP